MEARREWNEIFKVFRLKAKYKKNPTDIKFCTP